MVQRCNTFIDLLFYCFHTNVDIIYYHMPFYFIKSINNKNKKKKVLHVTIEQKA